MSVRSPRSVAARMPVVVAVAVSALAVAGITVHPWRAAASRRPETVVARLVTPRVLSVRPQVVAGRGGTAIHVSGAGFTQGTRVTVGGHAARVVAVRSGSDLVAIAPAGVGTEIVRAITPGGTSSATIRSRLHYASRVLIVGDSLGIDLSWGFSQQLDRRSGLSSVVDESVGSTGLVRSDFYDWPTHLRADLAQFKPDVVITLFGTNDQQAFATRSGDVQPNTAAWNRMYAARIRQIGSIVRQAGATLVWVGLPRMGPQSVLSPPYVKDVIGLDARVVRQLRGATYVDTWHFFTTPTGAYTPLVEVAPRNWQLGHAPDGTHLTPAGASVIDAAAFVALRALLTAR